MSGVFQNCCCDTVPTNCKIRWLVAEKTRHGFPPLYITAAVTGGTPRSKLRFLQKTIDFTVESFISFNDEYHSAATIDRLTGRADYTESNAVPGNLAGVRGTAGTWITNYFNAHKATGNASGSTTSGVPGDYGYTHEEYSVTFTYEGVDIIGFALTYSYLRTDFGVTIERTVITANVTVLDPYEDAVLVADVDDLLTGFNTGTGLGLDGMADDTYCEIGWNENGVNTVLGSAVAGACWFDVNSLSSYTTPIDPAIVLNPLTAADYYALGSGWWQGGGPLGAFDDYACTFDGDGSMPRIEQTDHEWKLERTSAWRFNVPGDVCVEFERIDNASTATTDCVVFSSAGGHVDVFQPHPEALSNSNIERQLYPSPTTWLFTSPGILTGGGCPCTAAP